ncbi:glycosyltransferase family 87 protein [Roseibium sp.]|uniref:glycosyltransferase family 87 protein n=1 Tax=Roseibium sp. TaxID=1936156 RepID=UPI003BACC0D7
MNYFLAIAAQWRTSYRTFLNTGPLCNQFGGPIFFTVWLVAGILTLVFLFGVDHGLLEFDKGIAEIGAEDFAAFYRGGQLALNGAAATAYDPVVFAELFSHENKGLLFLNPPNAFLFFEPLANLPYAVARGIIIVLNLSAILGLVYILRLKLGGAPYVFTLCSCGSYFSFSVLQISPVITFLVIYALIHHQRRPVLSALALAIATIKPQLGVLIPFFLISARSWTTLTYATVSTLFLFVLSVAFYGFIVWTAFFVSLVDGPHAVQFEDMIASMIGIRHSLSIFGASGATMLLFQLLVTLCCSVLVWYSVRNFPEKQALPIVVFLMCIAAPSFLLYDWLLLSSAMLLALGVQSRWSALLQILAGMLLLAPYIQALLRLKGNDAMILFSLFVPFLMISVCWLYMRELSSKEHVTLDANEAPLRRSSLSRNEVFSTQ